MSRKAVKTVFISCSIKSAFINEHIHHLLDYFRNAKLEFEIDSENMKDRIMFFTEENKNFSHQRPFARNQLLLIAVCRNYNTVIKRNSVT